MDKGCFESAKEIQLDSNPRCPLVEKRNDGSSVLGGPITTWDSAKSANEEWRRVCRFHQLFTTLTTVFCGQIERLNIFFVCSRRRRNHYKRHRWGLFNERSLNWSGWGRLKDAKLLREEIKISIILFSCSYRGYTGKLYLITHLKVLCGINALWVSDSSVVSCPVVI